MITQPTTRHDYPPEESWSAKRRQRELGYTAAQMRTLARIHRHVYESHAEGWYLGRWDHYLMVLDYTEAYIRGARKRRVKVSPAKIVAQLCTLTKDVHYGNTATDYADEIETLMIHLGHWRPRRRRKDGKPSAYVFTVGGPGVPQRLIKVIK